MGSPLKGLFTPAATAGRSSIFYTPPGAAPPPPDEPESYIGRASRYFQNAQDFIGGPKQALDLGIGLGSDYLKQRGIDLGIDTERGNEAGQLLMNTVGLKAPKEEDYAAFRKYAPGLAPYAETAGGALEGALDKTSALGTDPTLALIPESRVIGAAFLPGILRGAGEQLGEAGAQFGAGNYREAARHAVGGLVDTGFGVLAGSHAFGRRGVGIEDANRVAGVPNVGTLRRSEFVEGATVQPEGTPAPDLGYGRGGVPVTDPNAKGVDLTAAESQRIQQALAQAQAAQQQPQQPVAPVQPQPPSTPLGQAPPVDAGMDLRFAPPEQASARDTAEVGRLARMLPEMADDGLAQRLQFYESKGLAQSAEAVRGEIQRRQAPAPQPVVADPLADPTIAQDATQPAQTAPDTSAPPVVAPEPNLAAVADPAQGEQPANAPLRYEDVLASLTPEQVAVIHGERERVRTTDPLTGLKNKVGWTELADTIGDNDHAAVIDLRGFKTTNDTYGHDAADKILVGVGDLVRRHFGDESARQGGDEFGAVLRGVSPEESQARLAAFSDDLRAMVHTLEGPNGERIDIQGTEAHIGLTRGRDAAHTADLAANAHRREQGSGRRATDVGGENLPDLPRPDAGAAALPEAGVQDRGRVAPAPQLATVPQDAEQPHSRNNYPPEAQIAAEVEAAVPSAITALSGRGGEKGGKVWGGTEMLGTLAPGMHPAKVEYGLEDFKEGAGTIAAALKRDKGNPLEMRAKAAMGARFAEEMAQRGDAHEPTGGDASFNPDEFGDAKYSVADKPKEPQAFLFQPRKRRVDRFGKYSGKPAEVLYEHADGKRLVMVDGERFTVYPDELVALDKPLHGSPQNFTFNNDGSLRKPGEPKYAASPDGKPVAYEPTKQGLQGRLEGTTQPASAPRVRTEGREGEGPLFKQDEAARLKAEKESQGRLFKAGQPTEGASVTTEHVRSAFPKADITESDNGWTVKLPGDRTIRIDQRGEIAYQPEAFEAGYGRKLKEGEEQIVGSFNRIGRDAIIQLAKGADAGTLSHESFHAAMDLSLTPKEREAVLRHYKNEEAAADAYAKWRPSTPNTLFSKIVSFFRNIYRSFRPSWESAFEATRSGKAYERAGAGVEPARTANREREADQPTPTGPGAPSAPASSNSATRGAAESVPQYATAPKAPPQMPRKLAPIPDKPKDVEAEKSLGERVKAGEPPRVETKVAALREVAPETSLSRDAPRTWESLDDDIRKRMDALLEKPEREVALYEKARSGKINDVEVQTLDALVTGKREAYDNIRERLLKAQEEGRDSGPENTAYLRAAFDKAAAELAVAARSDVEAGTKLGRALAARARVMDSMGEYEVGHVTKKAREAIATAVDHQWADVIKRMKEDGALKVECD